MPLEEDAIRIDVGLAFPDSADPAAEASFDLAFERTVFSLTTYSSTPRGVVPWFREYARQHGLSVFDPRIDSIPKRDFAAASSRLREAEEADEAFIQRKRLPELMSRAQQGDIQAVLALGHAYFFGEGVPSSRARACRLYRQAAEAGDEEAMFNLASCYQRGEGVPRDINVAVRWYLQAAATDHFFAPFALGEIYAHGDGVPRDVAEAVRWFRIAHENGHQEAPRALRSLGALPPLPGL